VLCICAGGGEEREDEEKEWVQLHREEGYQGGEKGDDEEDQDEVRYEQVRAEAGAETMGADEVGTGSAEGDFVGLELLLKCAWSNKGTWCELLRAYCVATGRATSLGARPHAMTLDAEV
jgi:hypothetical protein